MRFAKLAFVALLIAVLIRPGHAQTRATSVPVSKETITIRLVLAQTPATATIQNGALARMAIKDGPTLGFIPIIAGLAVKLAVVEIVTDPTTGNERVHQLSQTTLPMGEVVHLDATPVPIEVELLNTASGSSGQGDSPNGPCTTCCVTCDGYTVCACAVTMHCGQCCCPDCCTSLSAPSVTARCPTPGSHGTGGVGGR